jgi:long-chain acyl-CoA synthetase
MGAVTLAQLLSSAARRYGSRRALIFGDEALTYADLDERAERFAGHLQSLGLATGDRVTLWAPNGIAWVVAYYGVLRAGLVVNPLNFLLTAEEVAYATADCGARVLVAGREKLAAVRGLVGVRGLEHVIGVGGGTEGVGVSPLRGAVTSAPAAKAVEVAPDSLAAILYTSGTTGRPKGAMLTHRSLLLNGALTAQLHGRTCDDVVVTALPLPHVYGAAILNAAVLTGMTLVLHARFDAVAVLADIRLHRATLFEGVPTMYHYLLTCPQLAESDVSSLTRCTVGGQTMPLATMQEVERRLGCALIELWGMTELGGLGTTHASLAPGRLGSIGVALPYMETRIAALEAGGEDPSRGEVGELCVRGPLVMQGYFGNAQATRESIDEQGWLRTGDLARQDAEGYLYVVDRRKDMILTAGYNVYPAEIERVLALHPSVALSAVGSVPDPFKGEVPKAYVVLRSGSHVSAAEILEHCQEHLAAYKVPRQVKFVSDLPKTSSGKILRRSLASLEFTSDATSEAS